MSQVSLDLSGIANAQPGVPEPISTALSALQTAHNDTDTKLTNTTSGHDHDGTDSKLISTASISDYTGATDWTPTIATIGGTLSSTGINYAESFTIGKLKIIMFNVYGTVSGNVIGCSITAPTAPVRTTDWFVMGGAGILDSGAVPRAATVSYLSGKFNVYSNGSAVLAAGVTNFSGFIAYKIA